MSKFFEQTKVWGTRQAIVRLIDPNPPDEWADWAKPDYLKSYGLLLEATQTKNEPRNGCYWWNVAGWNGIWLLLQDNCFEIVYEI